MDCATVSAMEHLVMTIARACDDGKVLLALNPVIYQVSIH